MGSKETMKHAQTLYEKGYITYMRTDSRKYCDDFIQSATDHIENSYGAQYINPNIDNLSLTVKSKENKKEESKKEKKVDTPHEAIRPTDILLEEIPDRYPPRTKSLYKFIRTHALQSCMSSAVFSVLTAKIRVDLTVGLERTYEYRASAEELIFAGWMVLSSGDHVDRNYKFLKSLLEGGTVGCQGIKGIQHLKDAVRHYTEAGLIQNLEKRGIGRPSTFASLISKIQERGYALKQSVEGRVIACSNYELNTLGEIIEEEVETKFNAEKNKLVIQPLGILVIEFLIKHLDELFNYDYTGNMERKLDLVVDDKLSYLDACRESLDKITEIVGAIGCDKQTFVIDAEHTFMIGKYGPVIKRVCVGTETDQNLEFLDVCDDIDMDRLRGGGYTLAELLNKPTVGSEKMEDRELGEYKSHPVILKNGKFGYYVIWGKDGEFKKTMKGVDKKYEDIILKDVIKVLSGSVDCVRVISDIMSIRKGKYGPYVYYKTVEMKKPIFKSLKTFKDNYLICDVEILMRFIDK
jgi:DNA topoisomerase-1